MFDLRVILPPVLTTKHEEAGTPEFSPRTGSQLQHSRLGVGLFLGSS